jgi:hypothetical protein
MLGHGPVEGWDEMFGLDLAEAGNLEGANPGGEQRIVGQVRAIRRGLGGHALEYLGFSGNQ